MIDAKWILFVPVAFYAGLFIGWLVFEKLGFTWEELKKLAKSLEKN